MTFIIRHKPLIGYYDPGLEFNLNQPSTVFGLNGHFHSKAGWNSSCRDFTVTAEDMFVFMERHTYMQLLLCSGQIGNHWFLMLMW